MTILGNALRLLKERGFAPVAHSRKDHRSFKGQLLCQKGPVSVKITIADWNFLEYPKIHIEEPASFLPALMPHIDISDNLCYFAHGLVTLDRYDPATAIAQCLNQATALLDRIAIDPTYRDEGIQNEFLAHWEYGQEKYPCSVLLGDLTLESKSANFFIINVPTKTQQAFITSNREEAERLAKALGGSVDLSGELCWLFQSSTLPVVPQKMPQTVKELLVWLEQWDKSLSKNIKQVLAIPDNFKPQHIFFAINTPIGWLGFGFKINLNRRQIYRYRPGKYKHYLHNQGGSEPLLRLSIQEVGSRFVHSRNLTIQDLRGKRVTVVGCGSIGSFVAQSLVRLGAGTGRKGLLKLIDPDVVRAENLGRHVLGYPSLLCEKSTALTEELLRLFPHSKIEAVTSSVVDHSKLFESELIVDATGEETVSELINDVRLQKKCMVPVLHVWVRGNGEAVQALWTDMDGWGCYRCLLVPDASHHRKERFKILKSDEPKTRLIGCRAFTPYAVSAPMSAAALAVDMVCAWLQGNPSPRFRTRSVETAKLFTVKNQDISKINKCPACGHI